MPYVTVEVLQEDIDRALRDSRTHTEHFMLRLDESSQTTLQQLIKQFGASKAEIIRQLIAQAKPEDFPQGWHMKALDRRAQQPRR